MIKTPIRHSARLGAPCGVLLVALLATPLAALADVSVRVAGEPTVLFDQQRENCTPGEGPDSPAIAFRDAKGQMVLFAPSFRNRAFVGSSLRALKLDCTSRFEAGNNSDPNLLDDRTWLHAVYSSDGKDVFALGSASFMPYRHSVACGAGDDRTDCWYNGMVALRSKNSGLSFSYDGVAPHYVILPPPKPYSEHDEHPEGFISATNLVQVDNYVYTLVKRRRAGASGHGVCVFRARAPDLNQWETWDGKQFSMATQRGADGWSGNTSICEDVGGSKRLTSRGLTYHDATKDFISVYEDKTGGKDSEQGIYYRTSKDLITWTPARLLYRYKLHSSAGREESYVMYPSIIDDKSSDRNFGHAGMTADLLVAKVVPVNRSGKWINTRQLLAIPIQIQ